MEISFVESCASTQTEILDLLKNNLKAPPFAIVANSQTNGVGSRGNEWTSNKGNLYFSFCVEKKYLPKDIPDSSISIYFAWILRDVLVKNGSKVWLKWPNDFYLKNSKIGGVLTNKVRNIYVCGIGLNLIENSQYTAHLDISIPVKKLVFQYLQTLEEKQTWKQIFSKFLLEFKKSQEFNSHIGGELVSLSNASLCDDGSILINNKRVYSLR